MTEKRDDRRASIEEAPGPANGKLAWQPPELRRLGKIRDLVQGGGGKLSLAGDGDGRKPSGQG